ncbi:MAG: HAD hydrolase family protein [Desulfobacteraceae bacterium]|nr:HAD hydrolase family protein [Desulfobacteraceae bacterium]
MMMNNLRKKVIAVDLDGTLLHPEPEAISVLGMSGYQYLSKTAADTLAQVSRIMPVVIATGRNARSVQKLVSQLDHVNFCGFVMENGYVSKTSLDNNDIPGEDEWEEVTSMLPDWERLVNYEKILGLIAPPYVENPREALLDALACKGKTGYLYQEKHKMFVSPSFPSKLQGISDLGYDPFIVIGDELNDLDLLRAGSYPATLTTAHKDVKQLVRKRNGYCSPLASHAAAEDLLEWAGRIILEIGN